jgi:hypothetical protein
VSTLPPSPGAIQPPRPSWALAIAAGAAVTAVLHAPALYQNVLWLPVCCTVGCTGAPVGILPAVLVLRRDPYLGTGSGFALGFVSIGLGALVLAVTTLLRGFRIDKAMEATLRDGWLEAGYKEDEVGQMMEFLHTSGPVLVVVAAALLALSGGVTSAVLAGWTDLRFRRRYAEQFHPPAAPPAGSR